jgi:nucleoside-diphosphate-sugar epimerase
MTDAGSMVALVKGCDAVVHAALWKPGPRFQGGEGPVAEFAQVNVVGTLQLITAARQSGVPRFVFLSSCAVHDVILDDRPLDESHPCWPRSHYGAHKAAIEKFVHSFGFGDGYNICALRPTGVFGLNWPVQESKWYSLIKQVAGGDTVHVSGGGKEVHAADVAQAVSILLCEENIAGQCFNCCDRYISQYEVACLARELSGSAAQIEGQPRSPKHQIDTAKLRACGMTFAGSKALLSTVQQILDA